MYADDQFVRFLKCNFYQLLYGQNSEIKKQLLFYASTLYFYYRILNAKYIKSNELQKCKKVFLNIILIIKTLISTFVWNPITSTVCSKSQKYHAYLFINCVMTNKLVSTNINSKTNRCLISLINYFYKCYYKILS